MCKNVEVTMCKNLIYKPNKNSLHYDLFHKFKFIKADTSGKYKLIDKNKA